MKIYIDIIFLINLTYDFLILNAVNIVLRRSIKVKRIFLCSIIGSISTFSIFIPVLNNIYITILISILMILVTFKYRDFIYFKNNLLYFYMVSVIFGGMLYLISIKFNRFYNPLNIYNKQVIVNFIGIIIIAPIIYILYIHTYKNNLVNHQNYYDLTYSLDNVIHDIKAFYDSGNLIKDPYKGRPVILISHRILKCDIKNKSPIYVPCNMINNTTLIKCYKPKLLIINNHIINNCLIGLWNNTSFKDGIDGIISGYIGDKIK